MFVLVDIFVVLAFEAFVAVVADEFSVGKMAEVQVVIVVDDSCWKEYDNDHGRSYSIKGGSTGGGGSWGS